MSVVIITGTAPEDTSVSNMARVHADGVNLTQATTSSVTWKYWDKADSGTVIDSGSLTVSSVIFDTLQTDARWDEDATGYNFKHDVANTAMASGGKTYRFEYKLTATSGAVGHALFEINTVELWGS